MKITMYELLGMIKDGKAPKKILYNNYRVYELDEYNHYMYKDIDNKYIDLYDEAFNCELDEFLNDEVEILEEEKKMCHKCHKYPAEYNQTWCEFCLGISKEEKKIPEKWASKSITIVKNASSFDDISPFIATIMRTQNEIIDYLKSKGDE